MAEAGDFPFLDDPRRLVGLASYRLTASEFQAGAYASLASARPWRRSRPRAFAFYALWHAALALGIWRLIAVPDGSGRSLALVATSLPAVVLWRSLYGLHSRLRRLHRRSPMADKEYAFAFTPERWMIHAALGDSSYAWNLLRVDELRDGFLFRRSSAPGVDWLPAHALAAPFDRRAAAEFFRASARAYRVIDRAAARADVIPTGDSGPGADR